MQRLATEASSGSRITRAPVRCRRKSSVIAVTLRGLTLTEILVVIGIIAILIAVLLPAISRVRAAQRNASCLTTLRQIGYAFQLYAADNTQRFPQPATANRSWEQMLRPYYRATFYCPADGELFAVFGSSYDWRDTGDSATSLAGKSLADSLRPGAVLAFEALPGWHAKNRINVIRLDQSAATMDDDDCFDDLKSPLRKIVNR